jgi:hypothetical protein
MPTVIYTPYPSIIPATYGVVGPTAAPAAGRGFNVQLAKYSNYNLNNAAQTTLFTTPASGITRAVISDIYLVNFSGSWTTASVSFGANGTPTDYATTQTFAGAGTNKRCRVVENAGGVATYTTNVAIVAVVTIAQGVSATCDIEVWGWYE